jgi:CRP/FNR family transcriptional regulator
MATSGNDLLPSPELKAELERRATIVSKANGTILFRRGDPVSGVYLIRGGRVSLGLDGATSVYPPRILGPGAIAGLPAAVSGNAYSLTAKVVEDSELAFVPRDAFLECLRTNQLLCFQIMDMLSGEISGIRSAFKQNGSNHGSRV